MLAIQDILRALRGRGFTQVEISRRTGIPQPRLSRWEAGVVPAGADDALRLHALHEEAAAAEQGKEAGGAATSPADELCDASIGPVSAPAIPSRP